ncbi:hypothetical protein [Hymenobacter negativus]|uniref:Uncharacterized protein n=1 Tax=Hymenobacter negativus TaxID=2795026 RepID=A0ABS3QP05_9BACT|nr:hypothetical protein [Hymenobacter negativus]MBO2012932.1 hypothetical protein [Hymenobacter negativus]
MARHDQHRANRAVGAAGVRGAAVDVACAPTMNPAYYVYGLVLHALLSGYVLAGASW